MKQNENGITLIEVLITLGILSFIGIIIWNSFFQGFQFSQKSIIKNQIQQETNIILSTLTKVHQTANLYTIKSEGPSDCKSIAISTSLESFIFDNSKLCYNTDFNGTVTPNTENEKKIVVTVSDKNDPGNYITIEPRLYRLKNGD
ncbi:prepilin-type N-terminal cleavage/methylation domain-containing protein [Bacillus sp. FJAT-49705]|uniref:Prepilin-type N-terminal cleavage/methylation domain-containing protein n=1 Tax=Cytobacillus citreus TaxID=2833586 RepID=A0ABS5NWG8_9BACI|nr:prepilin-type N-terminal cleavage/methylation domain-containing protein [Cytobacillus citreus]